jgi:hypothetical protein
MIEQYLDIARARRVVPPSMAAVRRAGEKLAQTHDWHTCRGYEVRELKHGYRRNREFAHARVRDFFHSHSTPESRLCSHSASYDHITTMGIGNASRRKI